MLRNVFLKTLHDQRRSLCWWVAGAAALAIFTMLFYPSIADAPEFDDLLENMPENIGESSFFSGIIHGYHIPGKISIKTILQLAKDSSVQQS